jgi:hypothetical protein
MKVDLNTTARVRLTLSGMTHYLGRALTSDELRAEPAGGWPLHCPLRELMHTFGPTMLPDGKLPGGNIPFADNMIEIEIDPAPERPGEGNR